MSHIYGVVDNNPVSSWDGLLWVGVGGGRSLLDRGGGIENFQHCIVIIRGQEARIPKTASIVGTSIGLESVQIDVCVFH